jgi:hypothetical protein
MTTDPTITMHPEDKQFYENSVRISMAKRIAIFAGIAVVGAVLFLGGFAGIPAFFLP